MDRVEKSALSYIEKIYKKKGCYEMPSNDLEKGIQRYVDMAIQNAPYNKIEMGIIQASTSTGYTVRIGKQDYTNVKTASENSHVQFDTVVVMIPNNNYSNMFILNKLKPV